MLDNVLEETLYPLEQQRAESQSKRRIGLGFTGLGDALIMLGLRYDSREALAMAERISCEMRDYAYLASIDLAKEKGPFPLFNAEEYLKSGFTLRLPGSIRDSIRKYGIRNSHLLSIAPTGTISLAFADNASNGIEPAFSWTYVRKKKNADSTTSEYDVEDFAYRLYRHMGFDTSNLPQQFVTALDLSSDAHMKMLQVVQPYIDTSISKTVNIPEDYPYEDFKDLYIKAHKAGLKGLSTYRPNSILGAVLEVKSEKKAPQDVQLTSLDVRVVLTEAPAPALNSLKFPGRPEFPAGNEAWCYMVDHPQGSFALFVGHYQNGRVTPFEVWTNGNEQPRGLGALAKSLSMDLRVADSKWVQLKLETLMKARGDDAFKLKMPPTGDEVFAPSMVAGLAKIIQWRYQSLGALEPVEGEAFPLISAMFAPKEPKTGTDGTMSWTVDIKNPGSQDDFVLGVKELVLPNGQQRPYSMWLSGEYPRALDGLCKILSLDMRVIDPGWIGKKLRNLLSYGEPLGDFMAKVPGSDKSQNYPSTVAYVARLIIHRYAMLGILTEEGYPVVDMGVLAKPDGTVKQIANVKIAGKVCSECNSPSVIRKDGCDFCTACGAVGSCG